MSIEDIIRKHAGGGAPSDEDRRIQYNIDLFNLAVSVLNETKRHNQTINEILTETVRFINILKSNE